jgi:hypothetical protein
MITLFLTASDNMILDSLPKSEKFNKGYWLDELLQPIVQLRASYASRKVVLNLFVDLNNSVCHNGAKITAELEKRRLIQLPYSSYSPGLSMCNFWAFGHLEHEPKDRQFYSARDI